jgi:hypothetical protein
MTGNASKRPVPRHPSRYQDLARFPSPYFASPKYGLVPSQLQKLSVNCRNSNSKSSAGTLTLESDSEHGAVRLRPKHQNHDDHTDHRIGCSSQCEADREQPNSLPELRQMHDTSSTTWKVRKLRKRGRSPRRRKKPSARVERMFSLCNCRLTNLHWE